MLKLKAVRGGLVGAVIFGGVVSVFFPATAGISTRECAKGRITAVYYGAFPVEVNTIGFELVDSNQHKYYFHTKGRAPLSTGGAGTEVRKLGKKILEYWLSGQEAYVFTVNGNCTARDVGDSNGRKWVPLLADIRDRTGGGGGGGF